MIQNEDEIKKRVKELLLGIVSLHFFSYEPTVKPWEEISVFVRDGVSFFLGFSPPINNLSATGGPGFWFFLFFEEVSGVPAPQEFHDCRRVALCPSGRHRSATGGACDTPKTSKNSDKHITDKPAKTQNNRKRYPHSQTLNYGTL